MRAGTSTWLAGKREYASTSALAPALASALVLLTTAPAALAQNSNPAPGGLNAGIIIMRDVPYRSAVRPGLPAPPFRVRTTPAPEVLTALDEGRAVTRVISDREAADISTGVPPAQITGSQTPSSTSLSASIVRSTTRAVGGGTGLPGVSGMREVGLAVGGAVRSGTGGIASTVRGALGLPGR